MKESYGEHGIIIRTGVTCNKIRYKKKYSANCYEQRTEIFTKGQKLN